MIIKRGIERAVGKNAARFCTPGHSGEGCLPLRYDVTELCGTDNLQNPQGMLKDAAQRAAAVFGAEKTFFLVNGSSVGIHSLIMSVCARGDCLIVDRGCHISVINALVLGGIRPVYLYPGHSKEHGISMGICSKSVQAALEGCPDAKGVLITSPNYYGVCSDIKSIAQITNRFGVPLMVDEAHGAHFVLSKSLPETALSCGADGAVQSVHKTLPCLTQGALLHLRGGKINSARVLENLNMLQTTSPSYLLLMSIDDAVFKMRLFAENTAEAFIKRCAAFRQRINATGKYKCIKSGDITRLSVSVGGCAGRVSRLLTDKYNIIPEMCDGTNIVFIAKIMEGTKSIDILEDALIEIAKTLGTYKRCDYPAPPPLFARLSPAEAFYGGFEDIDAKNAAGRICARAVYKMPPCICIAAPGEVITADIIPFLGKKVCVAAQN